MIKYFEESSGRKLYT